MKRILFVFALMSTILLSACNAKNANNNNNETKDMKTIELTKQDFLTKVANFESSPNEWKYLGDKPAILQFHATWCGPCKALTPVMQELAAEYDGQIYIYTIDIDKEPDLASAFGIRSVPTLIFTPMEGQPQMGTGVMPKNTLKEAIDKTLLKK